MSVGDLVRSDEKGYGVVVEIQQPWLQPWVTEVKVLWANLAHGESWEDSAKVALDFPTKYAGFVKSPPTYDII